MAKIDTIFRSDKTAKFSLPFGAAHIFIPHAIEGITPRGGG